MTKKPKPLSLEESLAQITQLITEMEQGELSLEQSLERFEKGITLIKHSQFILAEAEQKVQILLKKNNKEEPSPYESPNEST